jgi:hypothetical protein
MYANWLYYNCLSEFKADKDFKKKLALKNVKQPSKKNRLPIPVIALLHHYKNIFITIDKADEIARNNGYDKKNSGKGLYQEYLWFSDRKNRLSIDDGRFQKQKTKFKHLETAFKLLKGKSKANAQKDIEELKKKLENMTFVF